MKITLKIVRRACVIYILYLVFSCLILPLFQKEVSPEYKDSFMTSGNRAMAVDTEQVLCIDDNADALIWRLRMMEEAREEIILSTFDFGDDDSGGEIMAALLHAADRGVQVKVIVDGINGFLKLNGSPRFKALVSSPNVEARFYNPVNLLVPWRLNYRMHDKYIIVDNRIYMLGGRNTNDLFLGEDLGNQNVDRDILVYERIPGEETSLQQVRDYFDSVWSLSVCRDYSGSRGRKVDAAGQELRDLYETMKKDYPEAFGETDWEQVTFPARSVTLLVNPISADNKAPELWYCLCQQMKEGQEIFIQTPYIICNRKMYDDLEELCEEGKQIQILTNAVENGANPWGCVDYLNEKDNLLETGVEVFEYLGGHSLHTKTVLIDTNISVVGSFNTDMRSAYLDTETMIMIDCPALNAMLRERAEEDMEYCKHVLPDGSELPGGKYEPKKMSLGMRIAYGALQRMLSSFRQIL